MEEPSKKEVRVKRQVKEPTVQDESFGSGLLA